MQQLEQGSVLNLSTLQVDVKEPHHELKQLTKICFLAEMTLMLAWSQEEAGRIIEVYKMYENKPPDMIMEKQDSNPYSKVCYGERCTSGSETSIPFCQSLLSYSDCPKHWPQKQAFKYSYIFLFFIFCHVIESKGGPHQ